MTPQFRPRTLQEIDHDLRDLYPKDFVQSILQDFAGDMVASLIWTGKVFEATINHCASQPQVNEWLDTQSARFDLDDSLSEDDWEEIVTQRSDARDPILDEIVRYFRQLWPHLEVK